jgi:hypothetical protein
MKENMSRGKRESVAKGREHQRPSVEAAAPVAARSIT